MYNRSKTIGASDAPMIATGQWRELYDRKTGEIPYEPILAAEIGKELEDLNRRWFQDQTGLKVNYNKDWEDEPLRLAGYDWYCYTPDGLVWENNLAVPLECKALNPYWIHENAINKYMPQLQHGMAVQGTDYCYFSVIYLNFKIVIEKIYFDPMMHEKLFNQEKMFHWHLTEGVRP